MIRELTVRGARIRVRESGDPAHPPLLLLHGIGRSLEDWDPQHDRLAGEHRVISVDLPGFGLSEPMPGRVTLAGLADGVAATVDALGERRPLHVMGNSLGGAVAMRLLAGAPARVATLTLVNSAGFGKEVALALRILAVPGLGKPLLRRIDARSAYRIERSLFHDRAHVTPERVEFAVRVAARPENARVFLQTARELGTLRGIRAPWRETLLGQVAAHPRPALIVWGERDLILPAAHLAAARAAFPHARTHLFADTGHMPQIERADAFADLSRLFLSAHSPAL
ncbi:alpha/beta fold hydrolase [Actinoplanes sp. NPDC049599]|uniref:alpha/beta fold hydrolase n=1 Tax=Actinoplanes sp. NPDC049599 TaxID=3363903 RepID=UPI0037B29004